MNKLFGDKRFTSKKLIEFFDKKGFYIVLVLCLVIVGATAVFVSTRDISSDKEIDSNKIVIEDISDKKALETGGTIANSSLATTENNKIAGDTIKDKQNISAPKPTEKLPQPVKPTSAQSSFALPVFGEITFDYAQDKLVYSKTLGDWRTHNGVDIASERGAQVKSAADGIVTEIKNDPRYGITVIIEHQNGYKTVYANLAGDDMVTFNQIVKSGDVIGSVGSTSLFESAEPPHLHFEVWKNNTLTDPKALLPKK